MFINYRIILIILNTKNSVRNLDDISNLLSINGPLTPFIIPNNAEYLNDIIKSF